MAGWDWFRSGRETSQMREIVWSGVKRGHLDDDGGGTLSAVMVC